MATKDAKKATAKKVTTKKVAKKPALKVVKAMKSEDFVEEKGTLKIIMKRGVKIQDKTQNITVERSLNYKKGTFEISFKWNMDAVTGDDITDTATLDSINQMLFSTRDLCLQWQKEWKEGRPTDPDQIDMDFDDDA